MCFRDHALARWGLLLFVSLWMVSVTAIAADPCDAPQYVEGDTYATGEIVRNGDNAYQCDVGGWCSMQAAWAYEPGVGMYWELAWHRVGPCSDPNEPPLVTLTAPAEGEVFRIGDAVVFEVDAVDPDGTVSGVTYFVDGQGIGETTTPPFSLTWQNPSLGAHQVVAVARDDRGAETESAAVSFSVIEPDILSVRITEPAAGTRFRIDSQVAVTAVVHSPHAVVDRVHFFVDGAVFATDETAPFRQSWTAMGVGDHVLSARVEAGDGTNAESDPVAIRVTSTDPPADPGRVVVGYWETWDAVIHDAGHIPLNDIHEGYNVLNVAFPVILPDGTAVLEDGMAPGEDPPEPEEIAAAQAAGRKVLLSIGGAAAGMNLTSTAVVDRFIETIIPILADNGYDGIDIDIESGLVAGPSWNELSASQEGLLRIILAVTDHFGPDFMLTMAPETAYVTGGTIAYGGPWGAYLPIIDRVRDRLDWIQMQYYNGDMFGRDGDYYPPGTVEGMVRQTEAMVEGFQVAGGPVFQGLAQDQVVIGLPAITGAGRGYMTPDKVREGFDTLHAQYPGLRGLMTWSANWDASNGYEYVRNHRPYLDGLGPITSTR